MEELKFLQALKNSYQECLETGKLNWKEQNSCKQMVATLDKIENKWRNIICENGNLTMLIKEMNKSFNNMITKKQIKMELARLRHMQTGAIEMEYTPPEVMYRIKALEDLLEE